MSPSLQSVLGDLFELAETLLDVLDLGGDRGRNLGRLGRRRAYCAMKPYSGSSAALVQAQCGRNSAAFASSFSIARRRTSAASSMKPSSSPLKRSRVTVPPAAS